jgi:UDP-N-acetylglucosamine 2-epimerase (non-hydrolysing)
MRCFEQLEIRRPDRFSRPAETALQPSAPSLPARTRSWLPSARRAAAAGDTNSCLAAIPAKRRKIPIFHMEAGNRCFDQRVPEEINRRIVDHVSDINLTYTEHARRTCLEGLKPRP